MGETPFTYLPPLSWGRLKEVSRNFYNFPRIVPTEKKEEKC